MRSTSSVCYYSERESPSRRRQRRPILLSHWLPFPTEDQERSIQSNWQQSGSSSLQQSNEFILFNRIPQDLSTRLSMPSRAHLSLILSQRQAHRTFDPRQSEYRARVNRARLSFYRPVPGAVVAANSSSSLTRRGGQPEPARSRGDALIDSSAIMAVNTIIVPHGQEEVRQSSREQGTVDPTLHPQFSVKDVYTLSCIHCRSSFTLRGMRATLLGDTSTQLFSTDLAPAHIQMIDKEYTTPNCACEIRDTACLSCGNTVGYRVTRPCDSCQKSCNNGHLWMFKATEVQSQSRQGKDESTLRWSHLPETDGKDPSQPRR